MTNHIEPLRRPVAERLLPIVAARPARALARRLASVAAWARVTNGAMRLDEADVAPLLDPPARALLWHVLTETISTIGALTPEDAGPEATLAALQALAERVRERVGAGPPRPVAALGGAPPQIFVLEFLARDLQPCLGRWQPRLEKWRRAAQSTADWPLLPLWRRDVAHTRERLVERAWQLGMALGVPSLGRLLPDRAAAVPELIARDELAAAEAAASAPPEASALRAGWEIYVEAVTRMPAGDPPSGPSALGDAIAALDALAGEIVAALKAMPPARPNGAAETVQTLAFNLLTEGVQPFLAEWRPRYRKFAASERPEGKWRRAEECCAALAATRERCLPMIRALGRKIGAPPLGQPAGSAAPAEEETPPLQLPPPTATRP